ncbi:MAG: GNAT family N-acetyltransferase [Caldilinea sp. CFX5]|nr:GNAT family N-acetyltransferase [Caldilinea sp. CFX5]
MTQVQYQFVNYRPEHKTQIVELQRFLWSQEIDLNLAYWAWKYDRNPYFADPLLYLAFDQTQLVGVMGAYGIQWAMGSTGSQLTVPCLGDLVILPAYRSQGILSQLMAFTLADLTARGYPYVFDLSSTPETMLIQLMSGWRNVDFLQTALWQANPPDTAVQRQNGHVTMPDRLRALVREIPGVVPAYRRVRDLVQSTVDGATKAPAGRAVFAEVDAHPQRMVGRRSPITWCETPQPAAMADLVQRTATDQRIRHVRDAAFFAWRYQNPTAHYRFLYWGEPQLEGYLVLQAPLQANGYARVNMVDWVATNNQVRSELLRVALRCGFAELYLWSATLSAETKQLLQQSGFRFTDKSGSVRRDAKLPTILLKALQPVQSADEWRWAERHLLDVRNWEIALADTDGC